MGAKSKSISRRDDSAQAAAHSHRNVDGVEIRDGAKQLHRIRAYATYQQRVKGWEPVPSTLSRNLIGDFGGCLKVMSLLDDFDAKRSHGGIFLDAVVDRYDNSGRDTVFTGGKSYRLPVVSSRRGDHSVGFHTSAAEILEVYQTAAHFECTSGGMVLVLYPDGCSNPLFEKRPPVLRGRRHGLVNESGGRLELVKR